MENNDKNFTRPNNSKACQPTDRKSSTDIQASKPRTRNSNSRRREQSSVGPRNNKQSAAIKVRPNVDKRPRPRRARNSCTNGSSISTYGAKNDVCVAGSGLAEEGLAACDDSVNNAAAGKAGFIDYEENFVHIPERKKQNLNHLLNFQFAPRELDYSSAYNVFGQNSNTSHRNNAKHNRAIGNKPKYNKEQFMQANFQFVIKSCAKTKFIASPDTLIEWDLIEQINIQTTEEPQCPICLYPPIAAKLTRCGHAYCWPCMLHYLALSDKKWGKCPICYDAIHTADLKSTAIMQQRKIKVNEEISFQLMRRKKDSMFIEKFTNDKSSVVHEHYPRVSNNEDDMRPFSKFLIANHKDILDIIEREQRELTIEEDDTTCPEYVFVQQALDLLNERRQKLTASYGNKKTMDNEKMHTVNQKINDAILESGEQTDNQKNDHNVDIQGNNCESANVCSAVTTEKDDTHLLHHPQICCNSVKNGESLLLAPIGSTQTKYYYFYQSVDGQNIFLHPLNVKMLQYYYGTLDRAPLIITASILQQEYHSMDEENRRKFTCLGHLPLTCQYSVVEVELQPPIVSEGVLKLFKNDILFRRKARQRREIEERKREKKIDEINDRQMGKFIASTANLNLKSSREFPTCGFEEYLVTNPATEDGAVGFNPRRVSQTSYSTVIGETAKHVEWPSMPSPPLYSNNCYKELSTWGKTASGSSGTVPTAISKQRTISERSNESNDSVIQAPKCTTLSDVVAEAMSQKKQHNNAGAVAPTASSNKKNKKKNAKKMLPLFSTGINYNGN